MNKKDMYKKAIDLIDKIQSKNPFWVGDEYHHLETTKGILEDKLDSRWMKNE